MTESRFVAAPVLQGLKDFQRRTVDYVFQRLYGDDKGSARFLVADEVGLGKTMVARGIIAKTLEYLEHRVARIDVVYICSNSAIAKQNIKRLNVGQGYGFATATRLTYLPKVVKHLRRNKVNFISLTPSTTFEHRRSPEGHAEERIILYHILRDILPDDEAREGLLNLLQARVLKDNWRHQVNKFNPQDLDADLVEDFRQTVGRSADAPLYAELLENCRRFIHHREEKEIEAEELLQRYTLIGKLRELLATQCLAALEPDLVILDEFQRFKHLLNGEDETADLANKLFAYPDVRVLLLSATPYKMFTLDQERDEDDHYPDFINTLKFLFRDDDDKINAIRMMLAEHRKALHRGAEGQAEYGARKEALQQMLLQVMCRSERVATTRDHNAMLREVIQYAPLAKDDLQQAATADALARTVGGGDVIEYWKSAPYLINFMKNYTLRRKLDKQLPAPDEALHPLLCSAEKQGLKHKRLDDYQAIAAANPRMRALLADTIERGMWQLLWMPPSLPYSQPNGVYQDKADLTKALVFSAWNAVPDAVAALCSYEAERRMTAKAAVRQHELYDKIKPLLRFAVTSTEQRLTGMPVLAWLLPSPTLAFEIDPLTIALKHGGEAMNLDALREAVKAKCREWLARLPAGGEGVRADERWYWAAPILLDAKRQVFLDWCKHKNNWQSIDDQHDLGSHFQAHIDLLLRAAQGDIELGPRPDDLADVLCDLALAAPGVCGLRALSRLASEPDTAYPQLLSPAVGIALGFRSLFNMPETIAMLRAGGEESYWRLTLQYGMDGNMQAMLDEYVHVLREALGLQDADLKEQAQTIGGHIYTVLSLRTAQIKVDELKGGASGFAMQSFNTRCRFALRFGDIKEDNKASVRADVVRDAFNSPFRPFVLASTSIGQEGLDFHSWCHAVVHWNLPANPVDLEQREGRVHRYKGHAVRKNIAECYGLAALSECYQNGDPWHGLFQLAAQDKAGHDSDLIPFWIFEQGSARVERRVPLLPYSKDVGKFARLKRNLALYRMAFGQPRQQDLLLSLQQHASPDDMDMSEWLISLAPPSV